ncbi:MAG: LysR family transcriptional regulator [Acidimicrobiaceae bacterium]|jgi:LysR family transcriptional regulator, glycine cleavage system transcriptional activator|nr:LysR family transcriptional regulator [Acidimicrobiaceae bacterium]MBT5579259.1 LysR family transcriptional regulator [Acidimicrobiaceae bacterium]MBT5852260.1 LysR family transcriptional regulator [Acidimicrobiaceae bacterium]
MTVRHAKKMHPLLVRIPRLQMIAVFECAARLGTFTAAAADLGMTQPAVSRHIHAIERAVGRPLFIRTPNRVTLNPDGDLLLSAVQSGMDTITSAVERFRLPESTFLLAANPGFAQRWLVPHLDELQHALGQSDLRLRLFDRDNELGETGFNAAIHLVPDASVPAGSQLLWDEEVVPVAAPAFAERHGLNAQTDSSELLSLPLLHLDHRDRQWMDWQTWFATFNLDLKASSARVTYNNHALTMNEAIAGMGIALGWRGLVDTAIEHGTLRPVGPVVTRPEMGYYLIPGPAGVNPEFVTVTDWIIALTSNR